MTQVGDRVRRKIRSSVLDKLSLRCPSDIPTKRLSRIMNV